MLTEIRLANFKGFGTPQSIPLSKITLLFGPNSSGKTSILQSLLLLKQTLEDSDSPSAVLLPKGRFVDLGGFREMVYSHDHTKEISLGFKMVPRRTAHINHPQLARAYWWASGSDASSGEPSSEEPVWYSFSVKESSRRRTALTRCSFGTSDWSVPLGDYDSSRQPLPGHFMRIGDQPVLTLRAFDQSAQKLRDAWTSVERLRDAFGPAFDDSAQSGKDFRGLLAKLAKTSASQTDKLAVSSLRNLLFQGEGDQVKEWTSKLREYTKDSYLADIERVNRAYPLVFNHFLPSSAPTQGVLGMERPPLSGIWVPDLSRFAAWTSRALLDELRAVVHLGPLRKPPERHYIFSGNISEDVGSSGQRAPDLFYSEPKLVRSVNGWLKRLGVEYDVKVKRIGRGDVFELRLFDRASGLLLASPDVGFGISQVLPVVAQSLLSKRRVILIEQPELHLHPKLQAELGDFFASCSTGPGNNQFIIETHSEHLMLRLQALIRRGELSPSDVSVVFLEHRDGETKSSAIGLDERGRFTQPWPGGFFPERLAELK